MLSLTALLTLANLPAVTCTPRIVAVAGIEKPKFVAFRDCEDEPALGAENTFTLSLAEMLLKLPQEAPVPPVAPVPAKLGPEVAVVEEAHEADDVIEPEPPTQTETPVVAGDWLLVRMTSSVKTAHGAFVFVHLKVALVPAGTPVTVDTGDDAVVIVAVPLTTVHEPTPFVIVFPARVKFPLLHCV